MRPHPSTDATGVGFGAGAARTVAITSDALVPRDMRFEIIRDPLWNNIRVDSLAMRLVDTRAFQRLRYVRQLGLAYLVYPGATHSRGRSGLRRGSAVRSCASDRADVTALRCSIAPMRPPIPRLR